MSKHTYADSTLKSWTKDELIHQIRVLEHNVAVGKECLNNQAKLLKTWAPVVHAKWDPFGTGNLVLCSKCGDWNTYKAKYCPSCGAKMDA